MVRFKRSGRHRVASGVVLSDLDLNRVVEDDGFRTEFQVHLHLVLPTTRHRDHSVVDVLGLDEDTVLLIDLGEHVSDVHLTGVRHNDVTEFTGVNPVVVDGLDTVSACAFLGAKRHLGVVRRLRNCHQFRDAKIPINQCVVGALRRIDSGKQQGFTVTTTIDGSEINSTHEK